MKYFGKLDCEKLNEAKAVPSLSILREDTCFLPSADEQKEVLLQCLGFDMFASCLHYVCYDLWCGTVPMQNDAI